MIQAISIRFRRLLCCAALLLTPNALAECTLGTPVFTEGGPYLYIFDLEQGVQVPFNCTAGETPLLSLSSSGGVLDVLNNRFEGFLRNGTEKLSYSVPNAQRTLEVGVKSVVLLLRIPKNQWSAPSQKYSDTLTVTLTF